MIVHLIRHAHAGSRSSWDGPDDLRPLSNRGREEAVAIGRDLRKAGIDLIWSSSYLRCIETVEPLAERLGLEVEVHDAFTEGASGRDALAALIAAAEQGRTLAACSHGDVIPALIATALGTGATLEGPPSPAKAARYTVEITDGRVRRLTHHPAPGRD